MTSDAGAVRRALEACLAIAEEYREKAALWRSKGKADEATEYDHYADVAERCAEAIKVQM